MFTGAVAMAAECDMLTMLGLRDLVLIAPTPSQVSLHHHQQQQQQTQQPISAEHHANLPLPSSASLSVGLGFFPLLTATPCMPHPHDHTNDVQVHNNTTNNYWNLNMCGSEVNSAREGMMVEEDDGRNKHLMEGEESGEFRVCEDCGNRAKRDCSYRRCRTCCKGRGFDCSTHVRSTWVPASLRRSSGGSSDGGDASASKRLRALGSSQNVAATSHSSTSNATTTKSCSLDTSSCHQDAGFKQSLPRHVHAPAVFRCHRVSAIGSGEDEFAYLATVRISGHVFKGFLYDHGVGGKNEVPNVSELQLGNNGSGKSNRECSAIGVPNSAFPASAC
ncbi:protein LATERAL ROOT PRIMORDIUM 1-like [Abrus precatorius]|uniref:Protein LATERAL ROOT PRIMORDIUM 1-like n=1 Tax=Abrus precatorius TaxID=3816 RepID=A0A8B8LPP6_ABRPR|nr:protein LATERAL ROOT PRIMORDIUM 1-like [Abrus precatorius]